MPYSTFFRLAHVDHCTLDIKLADLADKFWSFWLCLAANGRAGGILPEIGVWHEASSPAIGDNLVGRRMWTPRFVNTTFTWPELDSSAFRELEMVRLAAPFVNPLRPADKKGILVIQGWMVVGGALVARLESD